MPVTDINPNNSGTLKLGTAAAPTDEYSCQVINFQIDPVANPITRRGTLCSPPLNRNGASSYAANFEYLQDWGATPSISEFLKANDAQLVYFDYSSNVPGTGRITGAFYANTGTYGGDAGSSWVSSGSCGLEGDYTVVPATPLADDTDTE